MRKKFQVSFTITIEGKDKLVFEHIATEERIKSDIESVLKEEFTFSVENLKVEEGMISIERRNEIMKQCCKSPRLEEISGWDDSKKDFVYCHNCGELREKEQAQ